MSQTLIGPSAPTQFSSSTNFGNMQFVPPNGNRLLAPIMVVGEGAAYVRRFTMFISSGRLRCQLRLETTDTGQGTGGGPQLTDDVESEPEFVTIRNGNLEFVLPGPTAPGNSAGNTSEPYDWYASATVLANFRAFIGSYRFLSSGARANTDLLFSWGVIPLEVSGELASPASELDGGVQMYVPFPETALVGPTPQTHPTCLLYTSPSPRDS